MKNRRKAFSATWILFVTLVIFHIITKVNCYSTVVVLQQRRCGGIACTPSGFTSFFGSQQQQQRTFRSLNCVLYRHRQTFLSVTQNQQPEQPQQNSFYDSFEACTTTTTNYTTYQTNDAIILPAVFDNSTNNKSKTLQKGQQEEAAQQQSISILLLNLVAIIWGTQHAIIKMVVTTTTTDTIDGGSNSVLVPAVFTIVRFLLASVIATIPILLYEYNNISTNRKVEMNQLPGNESLPEKTTTSQTTKNDNANNRIILRWGIEMGIYMFLGYSLQAIGLQYTTAQRSGFLLYLNVKFVPFLAFLLYQRSISVTTILSALTAFTGTILLASTKRNHDITTAVAADTTFDAIVTNENNPHILDIISTFVSSINIGDVYSIAAAVASAMFILRLETASNEMMKLNVPTTPNGNHSSSIDADNTTETNNKSSTIYYNRFNAICLWVVTLLSVIWTIYTAITDELILDENEANSMLDGINSIGTEVQHIVQSHWMEILYLGSVTTALANYIQTIAQRTISAERASIIYAMDPVYGAIFSYLILGETIDSIPGYIGALLIVLAAATNAIIDNRSINQR